MLQAFSSALHCQRTQLPAVGAIVFQHLQSLTSCPSSNSCRCSSTDTTTTTTEASKSYGNLQQQEQQGNQTHQQSLHQRILSQPYSPTELQHLAHNQQQLYCTLPRLLCQQQHLHHQQQQWQWQQVHAYHPATHRSRMLTVKLQQQKHWQDLQLVYDSHGGGARFNAIHLAAALQQLVRLVPQLELAPEMERARLKGFTAELVSACHVKLRRFDHKGLAILANSLMKLGYDVIMSRSSSSSSGSTPSSSSSSSRLWADLLQAVIKQLPYANSHSCSVLCSALASLLQQQQHEQNEQQHDLLLQLVSAMVSKLRELTHVPQHSITDSSRVALAACRLAAAVRASSTARAATAAATASTDSTAAAAAGTAPTVPTATAAGLLSRELQSLVNLAAEQAVQAVQQGTTNGSTDHAVLSLSDSSMLLSALAKARARPQTECVLTLLWQYSLALDVLAAEASSATGSRSRSKHYRSAAVEAVQNESELGDAVIDAAVRSLPSTIWAVGRLLELQQVRWQRQQQRQHQLQYCLDVWFDLDKCLSVCSLLLQSFTPVQLAQIATGLAKLVTTSQAQADFSNVAVEGGSTGSSSSTDASSSTSSSTSTSDTDAQAVADALRGQLSSPGFKQFVQQHVRRVEGLLPLMPVAQRLQLAEAYKQLGVQLSRSMAMVFERDAAVAKAHC